MEVILMGNPRNVVPENGARSPLNKILWEHIHDPLIVSAGKKLPGPVGLMSSLGIMYPAPGPFHIIASL